MLAKLDDINPREWAEQSTRPIRNVPKDFQAQYRETLADILVDHAEAVRHSDLIRQKRFEKVLVHLQIVLHSPPQKGGIRGGNHPRPRPDLLNICM